MCVMINLHRIAPVVQVVVVVKGTRHMFAHKARDDAAVAANGGVGMAMDSC
jgi:hypothetical protein